MARLTTELSLANGEREELNRQVFTARAEREDMVSLAERRQAELTRAGSEIRSLTEELARAHTAKVRRGRQLEGQLSIIIVMFRPRLWAGLPRWRRRWPV